MFRRKTYTTLSHPPRIVGTIHSPASLRAALRLRDARAVDFLEVRADALAGDLPLLARHISKLKAPLILTVRDSREGGAAHLSVKERRAIFERFLPYAHALDVELRNVEVFSETIATARARGVKIIASFHDFQRTPAAKKLEALAIRARSLEVDVLKIAARTSTPADLAALLSFLHRETRIPLSVMGMGPLGKISRLLFAMSGSVLNYGYLHELQVSGQWPALDLKKRLAELEPPRRKN
jgi:3-dehydroquinate dehydratase-1